MTWGCYGLTFEECVVGVQLGIFSLTMLIVAIVLAIALARLAYVFVLKTGVQDK